MAGMGASSTWAGLRYVPVPAAPSCPLAVDFDHRRTPSASSAHAPGITRGLGPDCLLSINGDDERTQRAFKPCLVHTWASLDDYVNESKPAINLRRWNDCSDSRPLLSGQLIIKSVFKWADRVIITSPLVQFDLHLDSFAFKCAYWPLLCLSAHRWLQADRRLDLKPLSCLFARKFASFTFKWTDQRLNQILLSTMGETMSVRAKPQSAETMAVWRQPCWYCLEVLLNQALFIYSSVYPLSLNVQPLDSTLDSFNLFKSAQLLST
ncbi:hypothetical protein B0H15DRAFT_973519 [Mycena belliarum]|uniref:Uncharacterized protein n=1 Tax=Mycena belliarum TaxID=1033014 RepID=A0AAD6U6B0_9AGAR|nr:hypothetical protein B0H15DRAFT_973519 [Mycena belliae]